MRERRDFEALKKMEMWGVAKKGKQGGEPWWKAWIKQLADEGYIQYVSVTSGGGGGGGGGMAYQVLDITPKGAFYTRARAVCVCVVLAVRPQRVAG